MSRDVGPAAGDGDVEEVDLEAPDGLREVAGRLESRGYEAWAVGGAVRDALMGDERADWDLATDARPGDVQRIFPRTAPIGVEHGTVGVLRDDEMYEVTTFRRDVEADGRHAVVEFAERIDADLSRRDFTINAMAWRPATRELRDPFEGRADLRHRVLRAVGEPAERFREDHLRVLRGLRFAGRYDMRVDEETREALDEAVRLTRDLSAERVREELMKVLGDRTPSTALRLYAEIGVLRVWYPEVAGTYAEHPRREQYLRAVDEISREREIVRLARWLVPLAEQWGERSQEAKALLDRLKFSNEQSQRTLHLLENYRPLVGPMDSSAQIREWLARVGTESTRDVFRLHLAGARSVGAEEKKRYLKATWRRVHEEAQRDPPLSASDLAVSGDDLLGIGIDEGPLVGVLLKELLSRVVEDPRLNERDELLALAERLVEEERLDEFESWGTERETDGEGDGPAPPPGPGLGGPPRGDAPPEPAPGFGGGRGGDGDPESGSDA